MNKPKVKWKVAALAAAVVLTIGFVGTNERDFEMSKNLDIYHTLFRELSIYYVDEIDAGDLVKKSIDEMLKSLDRPCFLVYLSDHGETPSSPHWRDASSPDLLAVPFIVWFSKEYRARYPEIVAAVSALADEPHGLDQMLPIFRVLVHLDRADALR